jgi:hypothetical protein
LRWPCSVPYCTLYNDDSWESFVLYPIVHCIIIFEMALFCTLLYNVWWWYLSCLCSVPYCTLNNDDIWVVQNKAISTIIIIQCTIGYRAKPSQISSLYSVQYGTEQSHLKYHHYTVYNRVQNKAIPNIIIIQCTIGYRTKPSQISSLYSVQ